MTINIRDVEDAILLGWDRADKVKKQFEEQWYAPVVRAQLGAAIEQLPDGYMDDFKQRNPKAYDDIMKKIGG